MYLPLNLMGGLLHLVQRGEGWASCGPPSPLLAVPNVTIYPSTAILLQLPLHSKGLNDRPLSRKKQELSYRKQVARQLRTQYVEGIYDNPVTLKSRLTVTQGHWKWNH